MGISRHHISNERIILLGVSVEESEPNHRVCIHPVRIKDFAFFRIKDLAP